MCLLSSVWLVTTDVLTVFSVVSNYRCAYCLQCGQSPQVCCLHHRCAYCLQYGQSSQMCLLSSVWSVTTDVHTVFSVDSHHRCAYCLQCAQSPQMCLLSSVWTVTTDVLTVFSEVSHHRCAYCLQCGIGIFPPPSLNIDQIIL